MMKVGDKVRRAPGWQGRDWTHGAISVTINSMRDDMATFEEVPGSWCVDFFDPIDVDDEIKELEARLAALRGKKSLEDKLTALDEAVRALKESGTDFETWLFRHCALGLQVTIEVRL